jgi:hypothetical protein
VGSYQAYYMASLLNDAKDVINLVIRENDDPRTIKYVMEKP